MKIIDGEIKFERADRRYEIQPLLIRAFYALKELSVEDRLAVMGAFCSGCGTIQNEDEFCHCRNDE